MDNIARGLALKGLTSDNAPRWVPISTNGWALLTIGGGTTDAGATTPTTYQLENMVPANIGSGIRGLRLVFDNSIRDSSAAFFGEAPNYNDLQIKATLIRTNNPLYPGSTDGIDFTFNGSRFGYVSPVGLLYSDPIHVNMNTPGERYYIRTSVIVPRANISLGAPTVTPSTTGGFVAAGNYRVSYTFIYPEGVETPGSTSAAVTTTGTTSSIAVTSPTNPNDGAVGYRVYMSAVNAAATNVKYYVYSGTVAFGTNYTITAAPSSTASLSTRQVKDNIAKMPAGLGLGGGTATRAANTGEWVAFLDVAETGYSRSPNAGSSSYGPRAILGLISGKSPPSVAIIGDSIFQGVGDNGYLYGKGGIAQRALMYQTQQYPYDITKVPYCGFVKLASSGETASQFANPVSSEKRRQLLDQCSTALCDYSINDLTTNNNGSSATLIAALTQIAGRFLANNVTSKKFIQTTIHPYTTSTDGFQTVANQRSASGTEQTAGYRVAANNVIRSNLGAQSITGESLFRVAATIVPTTNVYNGGDGVATSYVSAYPFLQGSETITVGGATKAVTTDYTYLRPATINGQLYASGVTFTTAPASAAAVTAAYTSVPGFTSLVKTMTGSSNVMIWDVAAYTEVDVNGNLTPNGGWWKTIGATVETGTSTGSNTVAILNDTTKSWAVDQWRGYSVVITSDAGNSAAVGGTFVISGNTATQIVSENVLPSAPSSQATYKIVVGTTSEGTHPASPMAMQIAGTLNLATIM